MFPRTVSRAISRHHLRAQCAIPQARVLAKPSVRRMLVMVMGIARCVLHACVATCARRPMHVFARCTACAMQARFARCAKWRSGPGPILLRSCARTLRSTRAIFFAYHSHHSSHRTGSPDAPGPPSGHVLARRPPESCILHRLCILLASLVPSHPIFYILLVSLVEKRESLYYIIFFI